MALLWVLNYSDGENSLLAIAERSGMPFDRIREAADLLYKAGLLTDGDDQAGSRVPSCLAEPAKSGHVISLSDTTAGASGQAMAKRGSL